LFAEHGSPHAEQFLAFVCVFVSQPFVSLPSQSPKPVSQVATTHLPFVQAAVAWARVHGCALHAPQLSGSELVFVSQPSLGSVLQFANGSAHVPIVQAPETHMASALMNEQILPHDPQFDGSPWVFTSHPVETMVSQFA
jgi:hypothetical protein